MVKEVQVQGEVSREQQVSVCRKRAEQELTLLITTGQEAQQLTVQDGESTHTHTQTQTHTHTHTLEDTKEAEVEENVCVKSVNCFKLPTLLLHIILMTTTMTENPKCGKKAIKGVKLQVSVSVCVV